MLLSRAVRTYRYLQHSCHASWTRHQHSSCVERKNQQGLNDDQEAVIYVHWPYCARRCTYCNFNKYISKSVDHGRMSECLSREVETLIQLSGVQRINSVFFGGGTPSLALPSTIKAVLDTIRDHVTLPEGSEVTLEANPTELETSRLTDFHASGINRLSFGIQSLNEDDLRLLGRDHSVTEALRCLEAAKAIYPGHVSVDLIFGRPGQSLQQWQDELEQMLGICDDHVSLYQLTLERGTQLWKWVESGRYSLPDNDAMADMYTAAIETLESCGFKRYEVSNFARNGAQSQHNMAYWTGKNYIGIGPGAHGRFIPKNRPGEVVPAREARIQTLEPDNWMYEVERYGHATRKIVKQSDHERLEELLGLGLRMPTGITNQRWNKLSKYGSLRSVFGETSRFNMLTSEGLLILDDRGLRATDKGLIVLDSVVPHLLVELEKTLEEISVS